MTINKILSEISHKMKERNIENSQLEAELIVSHIKKISREKLLIQLDNKITPRQIKKTKKICQKRIAGQPLAYLLGYKNFYNLQFKVSKHTLVPRPESELIVDQIITKITTQPKTIIADIGTGSGCLIISLADLLKNYDNINFWGVDISNKALKIAKKNSRKHHLNKKIIFFKGNLLKPIIKKIKKENERESKKNNNLKIIIIANLPYLTKREIKESPSIKFEPRRALYGGKDGLKYYRRLLDQIKKIKNNNNSIDLYQEISDWQKEKLEKIILKKIGRYNPQIETILDLAGKNRLIKSSF